MFLVGVEFEIGKLHFLKHFANEFDFGWLAEPFASTTFIIACASELTYQADREFIILHDHAHFHAGSVTLDADLAWQLNHREERSEPVSHGYMPRPADDRERVFHKHTLTGKLGARIDLSPRHQLQGGFDAEWQHNRRYGWGDRKSVV